MEQLNKTLIISAIDHLQHICHDTAKRKGFWGPFGKEYKNKGNEIFQYTQYGRNDGELVALMHSELSEALEEMRKKDCDKKKVAEELADCCIRIFDYCDGRSINLGKALIKKILVNQKRPYMHGKEF